MSSLHLGIHPFGLHSTSLGVLVRLPGDLQLLPPLRMHVDLAVAVNKLAYNYFIYNSCIIYYIQIKYTLITKEKEAVVFYCNIFVFFLAPFSTSSSHKYAPGPRKRRNTPLRWPCTSRWPPEGLDSKLESGRGLHTGPRDHHGL